MVIPRRQECNPSRLEFWIKMMERRSSEVNDSDHGTRDKESECSPIGLAGIEVLS